MKQVFLYLVISSSKHTFIFQIHLQSFPFLTDPDIRYVFSDLFSISFWVSDQCWFNNNNHRLIMRNIIRIYLYSIFLLVNTSYHFIYDVYHLLLCRTIYAQLASWKNGWLWHCGDLLWRNSQCFVLLVQIT